MGLIDWVWEIGNNRSARRNALWILASGAGPALLAAPTCLKGPDVLATIEYTGRYKMLQHR